MIDSVSSFNKNTQVSKPVQFKENDFAPTKGDSDEGMSTTTKTLIGLGALATAVVGGLLVKKRLDTKATEKLAEEAKKLLQKPADFTFEDTTKIAEEFFNQGKLHDKDEVLFVPKKILDDFSKSQNNKNSKWTKLYEAMNMSDNGFAVLIKRADGEYDLSVMKYFDPENISYDVLKNSLKDNKICIRQVTE